MTRIRSRLRRWRALFPGSAGAVLLGFGSPNTCLVVYDDDALGGAGTRSDPVVVTRDNLGVVGQLDIADPLAAGSVSSDYLTDGQWTRVGGQIRIDEQREHDWHYVDHLTPMLPAEDFSGAGLWGYGTRAGTLVHGNRYAVILEAQGENGDEFVGGPHWVTLDPETLVVPVVIGVWYDHDNPQLEVIDTIYGTRNLFDFNPVEVDDEDAPEGFLRSDGSWMTPTPLMALNGAAGQFDGTPDPDWFADMRPEEHETPPDDIWQQCNIQFQVVGYFVADYPEGWVNTCMTNGLNFGDPEVKLQAELTGFAGTGLPEYFDDLDPVFVSYGDLSACTGGGLLDGFVGSTPGFGRHIEIHAQRPAHTTAHELGHALGLEDLEGDAPDNLMLAAMGQTHVVLTPEQCEDARARAQVFSDRFDEFNWKTGRTYSDLAPPPPRDDRDDDPRDIIPDPREQVCCLGDVDVYLAPPGTCDPPMDLGQCAEGCCSDGSRSITRYLCELGGGTVVECDGPA